MPRDHQRRYPLPRSVEVISFQSRPCLFQQGSYCYAAGAAKTLPCPFETFCNKSARAGSLDILAAAADGSPDGRAGTDLAVWLAEPVSSFVVRSENQFNGLEQRHALRKHIGRCRGAAGRLPKRARVFDCGHARRHEQPNVVTDYTGFVDQRHLDDAVNSDAVIALGLLAPPERYLRRGATVVCGEYGPIFGAHGFACTVYSQHAPTLSGSHCAQAAVIMALGMLSDRGARVIGSLAITYLAHYLPQRLRELALSDPDLQPQFQKVLRAFRPGHLPDRAPKGIIAATVAAARKMAPAPDERRLTDYLLSDQWAARVALAARTSPYDDTTNAGDYRANERPVCRIPVESEGDDLPVDSIHSAARPQAEEGGLLPQECFAIFGYCRTGPQALVLQQTVPEAYAPLPADRFADRFAERFVEAHLAARFPVVAFVNQKVLHKGPPQAGDGGATAAPPTDLKSNGHAVVVVGSRRGEPTHWAIHDPDTRPYWELPANSVLNAAWYFDDPKTDAMGHYRQLKMIGVTDTGIRRNLLSCIKNVFDDVTRTPPAEAAVFGAKYMVPSAVGSTDFTIRLLRGAEIAAAYLTKSAAQRAYATGFAARRYWCFIGRVKVGGRWADRDVLAYAADVPDSPGQVAFQDGRRNDTFDAAVAPPPKPREHVTGAAAGPAERRAAPASPLYPSVMTSSSLRAVRHLAAEVYAVTGVRHFEPLILRHDDLRRLKKLRKKLFEGRPNLTETEAVADDAFVEPIAEYLARQLHDAEALAAEAPPVRLEVPALATYFPGLTSFDTAKRTLAVRALANTVRIGFRLNEIRQRPEAEVIVEAVCGSLLDPMAVAGRSRIDRCYVSTREAKQRLLLRSLREVIDEVRKATKAAFTLSLEMEPGETYVLNGDGAGHGVSDGRPKALLDFFAKVIADKVLKPHVGLNLDIAHMRIAGITAPMLMTRVGDGLPRLADFIAHAHISDHPGEHTRDQPVGYWTPVFRRDGGYYPYLELLMRRIAEGRRGATGLPFSGAFSLELEGCNRIEWIYEGLAAMKHLANTARHWQFSV